jgi:nucleoside-diphosphate-sugar epimerase
MAAAVAAPDPRNALLAGASGLVGRALLRRLLDSPSYRHVEVLLRRPAPDLPAGRGRLDDDQRLCRVAAFSSGAPVHSAAGCSGRPTPPGPGVLAADNHPGSVDRVHVGQMRRTARS